MLINTIYLFLPEVYLHVRDNSNYLHTSFSETINFTCKSRLNCNYKVTRIENYRYRFAKLIPMDLKEEN